MKKIFTLFTLLLTAGFVSSCSKDAADNVQPAETEKYYLDATVMVDAITRADISFDDGTQMVDIYFKEGDYLNFRQKEENSIWATDIGDEFSYRFDETTNSFVSTVDYSGNFIEDNFYRVSYGWSERNWSLDSRTFEYTQTGDGTTGHMAGLLNLTCMITWSAEGNTISLTHDTSLFCLDIVVPAGVTPKTLVWADVFKNAWSGDDNRTITCTFADVDELPADGNYTTYFCVLTAQPDSNDADGRTLTLTLTDTAGVVYEKVMLKNSYLKHEQEFYRSTVEFTTSDIQ